MSTIKQNRIRFRGKDFAFKATVCITVICLSLMQGCQPEKNPVVTTGEVSAITGTTATCGGTVEDNGASISVRGVCYNTDGRPDINDPHTTDGSGSGDFRSYLTGLQPNTTYYVRAYAGNENGLTYGNEVSFSTINGDTPDDPDNPITITTKPVTNISYNSAESGGAIIVGFAFANTYGVCYNTTGTPTLNDQYTIDNYYFPINGASSSDYISLLTDLQPNTTYYVRAYVTSSYGVTYGNEVSFTTSDPMALTIPQGWKLLSAISSPSYELSSGEFISDLMNGFIKSCDEDDIIVFSSNGTHVVKPGTVVCDSWEGGYNQTTNLGQWYFDNASNPTFLNMQIPFFYNDYETSYTVEMEKCRIIILNSNMLKISTEFCDSENPAKGIYTFTLTYVPAQ